MKGIKNVLITGGAGFIGSHLSERLVAEGFHVKILDNLTRGNASNIESIKSDVELVEGDIRDTDVLSDAIRDIDAVVHLAAINGTRFFYEIPHKVLDINVAGTLSILNVVNKVGIKRFVFGSSSEVYGFPRAFPTDEQHVLQIMDPTNPRFSYGASKIAGELMVVNYARIFGFDYTILRFHNVYGPKMGHEHVIPQFIRRNVLDEEFIVQGDGSHIRSFCFVSDAVDGIFLALAKKEGANQIFNIGNDQPTTINELIRLLVEISGKKVNPKYDTKSGHLHGSTLKRQPDISKARDMLAYKPKISLQEGLKITYQWYKNYFQHSLVRGEL